jgi:hypothetical protein
MNYAVGVMLFDTCATTTTTAAKTTAAATPATAAAAVPGCDGSGGGVCICSSPPDQGLWVFAPMHPKVGHWDLGKAHHTFL